jgi:hypothetical protein
LDLNVFVYGNKMIKGGFSLKQKFNIFVIIDKLFAYVEHVITDLLVYK